MLEIECKNCGEKQKICAWGVRLKVRCIACHQRLDLNANPAMVGAFGVFLAIIMMVVVYLTNGALLSLLYVLIYAALTLAAEVLCRRFCIYRYVENGR